jgi:hypothetical protein
LIFIQSQLTDDLNGLYYTMRDHYGYDTTLKKTKKEKARAEPNPDFLGPQVMLYDAWRGQGWALLSHGGFVTYPHHDASGLCTYVYPRSGCKLWGYFHPSVMEANQNRETLFKVFDTLPGALEGTFKEEQLGTILLEEGDIL